MRLGVRAGIKAKTYHVDTSQSRYTAFLLGLRLCLDAPPDASVVEFKLK